MIVALLVIAAVAVSLPIAAAAVVSLASRREDLASSLAGPARGHVRAAARSILAFNSTVTDWPRPVRRRPARPRVRAQEMDAVQATPEADAPRSMSASR